MDKNILITGKPKIGKSTLITNLVDFLKSTGKKVGGIYTPEIKAKSRVGFRIIDIYSHKEGILAHINQKTGPRVSKYKVNMNDLNNIGVKGIRFAISNCDFVIIDEIGKMELFSKDFCEAVLEALDSKKVIGTIGYTLNHKFAKQIKKRDDVDLILLTIENRDKLSKILTDNLRIY
ncbi:MAG: NTPase [Candidatus Helarchaeota archaeon]